MKQGWEIKKLGDISRIMYGYTAKANPNPAKAKYLRITDIQNNLVDWNSVPNCDLTDDEFFKYQLQYGDIVFARTGATTGKSFLVSNPPDAVFASYLIRVQTNLKQVLPEFLNQFFQTSKYWNEIDKGISGSAQGGFNATKLRELEIPFPPLAEQKRIVAKLDECFKAIEIARANVEKNLNNAKELFQSQLNQIFSQKGDGWVDTLLGENIVLLTGFAFKSKDYSNASNAVNLLRGDNIMQGTFRWKNVKRWSKTDLESYEKYHLRKNDLVLAMDRTWIKAGVKYSQVTQEDLPCLLVQRVARIRGEENLSSSFLYYLIGSPHFTQYVLSIQTGLGVPHISATQINNFMFKRPTISEQIKIVKQLDELKSQTQSLESNYQQELDALDELKKSILQKAFMGEL